VNPAAAARPVPYKMIFMKLNIILAFLVLVTGYATCRKFQDKPVAEAAPAAAPAPGPETEAPGTFRVSHAFDTDNPDSARIRQVKAPPRRVSVPVEALPPASTSRKVYLSEGWWHLSMAFQPSDSTIHREFQHKWLKFRQDQTFDLLIANQVVETGRWNWDEEKSELYLSCQDPYLNNTWAVKDNGYVMIWRGNTALNVTGIQVRVVGQGTPPPGQ
jgi:hypothetical protein